MKQTWWKHKMKISQWLYTCAQYQLSIDVNVEQLQETMSQRMFFDFTFKLVKGRVYRIKN
jgi:hypothetical protein